MKKSIVSIFMSIFLMFIFSGCVQKMERAPIAEDKLAKEFKTNPDFANLYISFLLIFLHVLQIHCLY